MRGYLTEYETPYTRGEGLYTGNLLCNLFGMFGQT